jgi:type VI secretion system secreted protein VgrG
LPGRAQGELFMSQITQDNRRIAISDFSLGKDALLLTSFQGSEFVSALFHFEIAVLSENPDITAEQIIGKSGTVTIRGEHPRKFNGFISTFRFGEINGDGLREYGLTMVPWLWFLTLTNDHRIFQDKNTKDIVSQIFNDCGYTDFEFKAKGGSKREYCIQHNESDFDFVTRLLAEDGIAYYFKHEEGKHTLYLVDQQNAYQECADKEAEYSIGSKSGQISRWEHIYEFKKGQWTLNDYNFREPAKNLTANSKTTSRFANNAKFEHYEYPGLYDPALGGELVKIRLDAEEADRNLVAGGSDFASFYAGGTFKLVKHTTAAEKGSYILLSVTHVAKEASYFTGEQGQGEYLNSFFCVPANIHFRPKSMHRPVMRGPQSAVVVGPPGEEIYTDEFGRIKVQFIWDRLGKADEKSSCFLRVTQVWAGNQWGASFIPRIGHEVIVDFLDGDPDRPLVTGSVYNGKNAPPFASKTQSGVKSRSTKEGSPSNFNEFRFEDKKGAEQIFIHAEKNYDIEVENDQTLTVDHDRTKTVKNNENSTIEKDRNKTVNNNQTETIAKNKSIDVGENHTETIGKDMRLTVQNNLTESVEGKHSETVTKAYALKAQTITLQADDQITLKTGSAQIVMKSNGDITLSGNNINIKGSGNVVIKGSKVTQN